MRIVVDFDGTLALNTKSGSAGMAGAVPNWVLVLKLRQAKRDNAAHITLHSARGMKRSNGYMPELPYLQEQVMGEIQGFLAKWGLTDVIDEIVLCRPYADVYIDDRTVPIGQITGTVTLTNHEELLTRANEPVQP